MFMAQIYGINYTVPYHCARRTRCVEATRVGLKKGSFDLALTIVDIPGFRDTVENILSWQTICDCIATTSARYFSAESRTQSFRDHRFHCSLYFIPPRKDGLILDVKFMKSVRDKLNLYPMIANAGTTHAEESVRLKRIILTN
ncbi:hypothetical protein HPB50_000649 [Hyalomma asiaticum]|uniref:Uncharacterized protein n=1 Tax=Hyalomma asiaticum TaxID=266040 RepID=A0ACB7TAS5_HYAAI|nr:hypothetical protein HPB50_000649 [Hyalomma asiaticum]